MRKLMRYLRWSNLVRKRFSISTWETCSEKDLKERQDLTPDPSSRVPTNGNHDRSVTAPDAKEGDSNHGVSTKDGLTCAREEAYKETCHRYTFSDRGDMNGSRGVRQMRGIRAHCHSLWSFSVSADDSQSGGAMIIPDALIQQRNR